MPFYDEDRSAVLERGEHNYSGIHEVADTRTPVDELAAREMLAAMDAREAAWERLQKAQAAGNARLIDRRQLEYAEAQERVRLLEEEDGEPDWQSQEARRLGLGEALGAGLEELRRKQRLQDFRVFIDYLAQGSVRDPWDMFKNLLALLRRVAPEYLGDLTQTELAAILHETKGAVQAREKRVVEAIQKRWGVLGYRAFGGTKTEETREKLSQAQKGNQNRRKGARKKHQEKVKAAGAGAQPVKGKAGAKSPKGAAAKPKSRTKTPAKKAQVAK